MVSPQALGQGLRWRPGFAQRTETQPVQHEQGRVAGGGGSAAQRDPRQLRGSELAPTGLPGSPEPPATQQLSAKACGSVWLCVHGMTSGRAPSAWLLARVECVCPGLSEVKLTSPLLRQPGLQPRACEHGHRHAHTRTRAHTVTHRCAHTYFYQLE